MNPQERDAKILEFVRKTPLVPMRAVYREVAPDMSYTGFRYRIERLALKGDIEIFKFCDRVILKPAGEVVEARI
jgi:hypothetical protein